MFQTIRTSADHHWTVGITMLVLVVLIFVKLNKDNYFFSFLNSLHKSDFYSKKFSEVRRIEISEVLLFIVSLIGLSFFLLVVTEENSFSILNFLQILFLITILILSKYLIEKIIGDLFEFDQILNKYLFYKQGVLSWLGLFFLFPIGLFVYFQDINAHQLIFVIAGLAIIIYLIKLVSYFVIYQKYILTYWFYFILYLCTFEIAPYFILFKVFKIN